MTWWYCSGMTQIKTFTVRDSQYQFSNSKMATFFFFCFFAFCPIPSQTGKANTQSWHGRAIPSVSELRSNGAGWLPRVNQPLIDAAKRMWNPAL